MSERRGLGAALLLALLSTACAPATGADSIPPRTATVTVAGTGSVSATPDQAEITTGVVTQAETAARALAANSQAMERLLQSLGTRP